MGVEDAAPCLEHRAAAPVFIPDKMFHLSCQLREALSRVCSVFSWPEDLLTPLLQIMPPTVFRMLLSSQVVFPD